MRPPKTHCFRGHELTAENTYRNGKCKLCKKEDNARWNTMRKEMARLYPMGRAERIKHARQPLSCTAEMLGMSQREYDR